MFPSKVRIFSILFILLPEFAFLCLGQPFSWAVHDAKKGDFIFSVRADTLFGLSKDLFAARLGNEHILFRRDPFHPVSRFKNSDIKPLIPGFFAVRVDDGWKLFQAETAGPARAETYQDFRIWKDCMLAAGRKDFLLLLPSGEEIRADSVQFSEERKIGRAHV